MPFDYLFVFSFLHISHTHSLAGRASSNYCNRAPDSGYTVTATAMATVRCGAVQFGPRPDTWPASVTVFGESRNGIDCADAASVVVVVVVCEVWQRLMYSASEHKTQDTLVCSFACVCVCVHFHLCALLKTNQIL